MGGFFKDLKGKRDRARADAARERARAQHEAGITAWRQDLDEATARLELAEACSNPDALDVHGEVPILLKKDELALAVIKSTGLIEMGRERGTYQGGSQGVSLRVMKGVSYRVGAHKGEFVPGPEVLKVIDSGTAVITNQRVVFQGAGKTREWLFSKWIGVDHNTNAGSSMLHVSNRQNASGLAYGTDVADEVRFRLDVALALYSGDLDDFIAALKEDVTTLEAARPVLELAAGGDNPVPELPPPPIQPLTEGESR